jgi:hypothetical protein
MAITNTGTKPGNSGGRSPYCAFRNDRVRLWALVSRDIRLVLIAGLMVVATPSVASRLTQVWMFFVGSVQ